MSNIKATTLIFIAFLLSGCALTDNITRAGKGPAATPTQGAAAAVVQVTATLKPSTPTPVQSPSPIWQDTQIAAQKDSAAQQIVAANKLIEAADKQSTNLAKESTLVTRKETHEHSMVNATTTLIVASGTKDEADRQFQKIVPTLIVAGTQAMYTGHKATSEIALNFGVGLGVAAIGLALLVAMTTSRKVAPPAQPAQQVEHEADEMKQWERSFAPVSKTGMGLHLTPPGDKKSFMQFASAVSSGRKGFAKPDWEGADSPYTRETYKIVYNWLWQYKLIELPAGGKIRWTAEGQEWVDNWIEKFLLFDPPSPTEPELPGYTDFPAKNSQTPENQPPESGGGVVESAGEGVADVETQENTALAGSR